MKQARTFFCLAAVLILASAFFAQAKQVSQGYFTADMPSGWKMESENSGVGFYAPKNGGCLNAFIWNIEDATRESAKKEATERANGNAVMPLGGGYIYKDHGGGRAWVITDKGIFCEFSADKAIAGLEKFMGTFKPDNTPGVKRFIDEVRKPEVISWLSFESDPFSAAKAEAKGGDDAPPAGAGDADDRTDVGDYSVQTPKDWMFSQEESMTAFRAPEDAHSILVLTTMYENGKLDAIIKEQAGKNTEVRKQPDGRSYMYEDASGSRVWGMLSKNGQFCEITVENEFEGTGAFLASMKPGDDAPGMKDVIKAANSPEVVAWLSFAPEKAAAPAKAKESRAKARPFKGNGLVATVPPGWSAKIDKNTVVFTADDESAGIVASLLPLPSDKYKDFEAFSKKFAKQLGGSNIRSAEGMVEFQTKDATGVFSQYGKKALLLMLFGETDEQVNLSSSIVPE